MVGVIQAGRRRRRVERSGTARIVGGDVISAVSLLVHWQRLAGRRIGGVEIVVADEIVDRPVHAVGAALRDDVDVPAESTAELRLSARRDYLKLFDGIHTVRNAAESRRVVVR